MCRESLASNSKYLWNHSECIFDGSFPSDYRQRSRNGKIRVQKSQEDSVSQCEDHCFHQENQRNSDKILGGQNRFPEKFGRTVQQIQVKLRGQHNATQKAVYQLLRMLSQKSGVSYSVLLRVGELVSQMQGEGI